MGEILLAIHEDKLPIQGIFAWGETAFHLIGQLTLNTRSYD